MEIAHGPSPVYNISEGMPETLHLHGIKDSVVRPRHAGSLAVEEHEIEMLEGKDYAHESFEGTI